MREVYLDNQANTRIDERVLEEMLPWLRGQYANPQSVHREGVRAKEAVERLNKGIALAREKADNGTRELLESILTDEEESVDWHETQLSLVKDIGRERYLAQMIHDE